MPDFTIPKDIEVDPRFYAKEVERAWINEWSLALLAKEVLLHSGAVAKKGASLSKWNVLGEFLGQINKLEGEIYGAFGSSKNVLVELIRIAHRTFEWQGNGPRQRSIIRYHMIFNTPEISEICVRRYGLTIYEVMACGTAVLGHYLDSHSLRLPITSQIAQLPVEKFKAFLSFVADDISTINRSLRASSSTTRASHTLLTLCERCRLSTCALGRLTWPCVLFQPSYSGATQRACTTIS